MAKTYYEDISAYFNDTISGFALSSASKLIDYIAPTVWTCLGIFVVLYAIMIMTGRIKEYILDGVLRIVRFSIILGIALNVANYAEWFINVFTTGPEELAKAVMPNSAVSSSMTFLDKALADGLGVSSAIWESAGKTEVGKMLAALIVFAATICLTGIAGALAIGSKVAITLLLSVGPIFVACLAFESSKRFFETWVGLLISLSFYSILSGLCIQLVIRLFQIYAAEAAKANSMGLESLIGMLIAAIFGGAVLKNIPNMASTLGGGVSINTIGVVEWAMNKLGRGGTSAAKTIGKGAVGGTKAAGTWAAKKGVAFWRQRRNNSITKD